MLKALELGVATMTGGTQKKMIPRPPGPRAYIGRLKKRRNIVTHTVFERAEA